jgi:hypothetical protein
MDVWCWRDLFWYFRWNLEMKMWILNEFKDMDWILWKDENCICVCFVYRSKLFFLLISSVKFPHSFCSHVHVRWFSVEDLIVKSAQISRSPSGVRYVLFGSSKSWKSERSLQIKLLVWLKIGPLEIYGRIYRFAHE